MADDPRVLLVDDDPGLLRLLRYRLSAAGCAVEAVDSGEKALACLPVFHPQLVITDLQMSGMDGMALFEMIHEQRPTLPVVILTAHGTIPDAVAATRRGLFGFLTKPFKSEELLEYVRDALRISGAEPTHGERADWCEGIITRNPAMEAVLSKARLAARTQASILIEGDSGTGKELVARAVHRASPRAEQPFVAINCTAIPESLLESELFGHDKGSFTGATRDHAGLFRAAEGGTLFLDEIGDMSLSFQAKLLRVLQEKEIRPVGTSHPVSVDTRIIAATHRNLEKEVLAGRFREDLYYRLNVVSLSLPKLVERREDIPLLAAHFVANLAQAGEVEISGFSPDAMECLVGAPWPGNVRQLHNLVEQAVALSTTPIIPLSLVQTALRLKPQQLLTLTDARDRFERDYLVQLLKSTHGNVSRAARLAGRDRSKFYKLLRRHNLEPAMFRQASLSVH